jgi:Single-stranded DNA-specific exonuclease
MKDMDLAVQRLDAALQNGERILLYGDYDVDGTTSVALMYAFLSGIHENLDYYLPDRDKEGYGVSMQGVEYAATRAARSWSPWTAASKRTTPSRWRRAMA